MDIITWSVIGLVLISLVYGLVFYYTMRFRRQRRLKYRLLKYKYLGGVPMTDKEKAWYTTNPDAAEDLKVQLRNRIKWTNDWFKRQYKEFVNEVKKTKVPFKENLTLNDVVCGFPKEHVEKTECEDYHPKFRNLACELREPDGISESLTDDEWFGEPIKTKKVVKKGVEYLVLEEIDGEPVPVVRRETGDLEPSHAQ